MPTQHRSRPRTQDRSTASTGEALRSIFNRNFNVVACINLLVMTTFTYADPAFVPGVDDDPAGSEARGDDEGDSHVYRMTAAPQVEDVFKSWKAGVLTAGKPKDTAE